jgi:hypothetical protein
MANNLPEAGLINIPNTQIIWNQCHGINLSDTLRNQVTIGPSAHSLLQHMEWYTTPKEEQRDNN